MKKIDKLVLKSFLGPFVLTFVVAVFILLTQTMLKYFDDFVGKNLGMEVFAELIFYFSIFTTPVALPLAVLLSSLMTYGNLGEHFELTAIKGSGISLLRTLKPIFVFSIFLAVIAFLNNNYIVPKANLKAYSLLYDIKKKKPALDLPEGAFYNGIRGLSIKVNWKDSDGNLRDVIIYDHRQGAGNSNVVLADSGRMYTIYNERYLVLELFRGNIFAVSESPGSTRRRVNYNEVEPYRRDAFDKSKLVLSLADFDFQRTREELFKSSRLMKNLKELSHDIDSMREDLVDVRYYYYKTMERNTMRHLRDDIIIPGDLAAKKAIKDSLQRLYYEEEEEFLPLEKEEMEEYEKQKPLRRYRYFDSTDTDQQKSVPKKYSAINLFREADTLKEDDNSIKEKISRKLAQEDTIVRKLSEEELSEIHHRVDSFYQQRGNASNIVTQALSQARFLKSTISAETTKISSRLEQLHKHEIEEHKKFAQAIACIIMFLVGAPLGSIIKRGGLGVPVIISIIFFIAYYVLTMTGEKWARQGIVESGWGTWAANLILLPIGLFFLKQARIDARLFDSDYYNVVIARLKRRFNQKFGKKKSSQ